MNISRLINQQFIEAQRRHALGDVMGALRVYETILKKSPETTIARVYRLASLAQLGRGFDYQTEATELFNRFGEKLSTPELVTLSIYFKTIQNYEQQHAVLLLAKEKNPTSVAVAANLGNYFLQRSDLISAKKIYLDVLTQAKDEVAIPLNLARIAIHEENFDAADEYLFKAENISPNFPDIAFLRAVIANHDCDYERCEELLQVVLSKNPVHRDAWRLLRALPAEVITEESFNRAVREIIKLKITDPELLLAARHISNDTLTWAYLESLDTLLESALRDSPIFNADATSVFTSLHTNLSPPTIRHIARMAWKQNTGRGKRDEPFKHEAQKLKTSKIRLAYLSSDFRDHVVARIVTCALLHHNKNKFELYAYSNLASDGSTLRSKLSNYFDHWTNIGQLTDLELAQRIKADSIDILVDLNGITRGTRVLCFQYRPAPLQMTWVGMPGTLGAGDACDYLIADHSIVDEKNRDGFDENIIYLPCSSIPVDIPIENDQSMDRREFNLPQDKFLFSVFCNERKYHPAMIKAWAQILHKAPESVILFIDCGIRVNEKVIAAFSSEGISEDRTLFLPALENSKHLLRLAVCNCALDTWPYGAGGTCVDAVRAGIPMVNLKGPQFHTRNASSILNGVKLGHFVTESVQDYVQRALQVYSTSFNSKHDAPSAEVSSIQPKLQDVSKLVIHLESAYEMAFGLITDGKTPVDIKLT